jgi:hypothetical protein
MLAATAVPASAANRKSIATVDVHFDGSQVAVESSKDLSNVVLVFCDDVEVKIDGLDEPTGEFAGWGDHEGETIAAVYVKSGSYKSGDGPGYGERFDAESGVCDDVEDPTTDEPGDGNEDPTTDEPGDGGDGTPGGDWGPALPT